MMNNPILMLQLLDGVNSRFAGQRPQVILAKLSRHVGRKNLFVALAVKILPVSAKRALSTFIRIYVAALLVFDPGQSREMTHEARKAIFTFAQRVFGLPAQEL